jgi:predicted RNase H-like HicB family nuclease
MNDHFTVIINREDQFYVARCQELAITSQGDTTETAAANIREAIDLYLETWGDPYNPPNPSA